jgi:hypothetical protein
MPKIPEQYYCESAVVKSKPDFILVLIAAFGIGVLVTMLLPLTATDTVAAPASELQAGLIIAE